MRGWPDHTVHPPNTVLRGTPHQYKRPHSSLNISGAGVRNNQNTPSAPLNSAKGGEQQQQQQHQQQRRQQVDEPKAKKTKKAKKAKKMAKNKAN